MKSFRYLFSAVVSVVFIAGAHFFPAQALNYNPAAEEYLQVEVLADGEADLAMAFDNADERVVRADFIVALWQDPSFQAIPFFKLRNATIIGDIEAEETTIPFDVQLQNCELRGGINLARTETKTFRIHDSLVGGPVKLGLTLVKGDLVLYNSTFEGGVTLFGTDISSNLFAGASKFLSTEPAPSSAFPFELWTTHVGQTTEFREALFKGEVKADDAKFGVDLNFNNAVFEKPVSFRNIQVGNSTDFRETRFEGDADFRSSILGQDADFTRATFNTEVSFESSIMDRDAAFTGSTFNGNANFAYLAVARFLDFDQTTFNHDLSFIYTTVGWPYFEDAIFNGKVDFEGLQTTNDFDFTGATYNYSGEPFSIRLIRVTGKGIFNNFTAPAGLWLDHSQFEDLTISGADGQKFKSINLDSIEVDGDFDFQKINTDVFSADGLTVTKSSAFRSVSVNQSLDLSNAVLGHLAIDQFVWPPNPLSINLHGAAYTDINLNGNNRAQDTWKDFLEIIDQYLFSVQRGKAVWSRIAEVGRGSQGQEWTVDGR